MSKLIDITKEGQGVFGHRLDEADKGDRIIYHVGKHNGGPHRKDAMIASDAGLCMLVLKRLDKAEGVFACMAVKR
jgi:hypothetical protein